MSSKRSGPMRAEEFAKNAETAATEESYAVLARCVMARLRVPV